MLGSYRSLYRQLSDRRRRQLIGLTALTLLGTIAEVATIGGVIPLLSIATFDKAESSGDLVSVIQAISSRLALDPLVVVSVALITTAICACAIRLILNLQTQKVGFGIGYDIAIKIYKNALHADYAYHLNLNSSTIVGGMNKIQSVTSMCIIPVIQAFTSVAIALSICFALLTVNPIICVVAVATIGAIYSTIGLIFRKRLITNSATIATAHVARVKALNEGLGGIRDIILDSSQPVFLNQFAQVERRLRQLQAVNRFVASSPRYIVEACGVIVIAIAVLLLSSRHGGLAAALPFLGAFALGAQRLLPLVQQIYSTVSVLHSNHASLIDILHLMDEGALVVRNGTQEIKLKSLETEIRFTNVSYRYSSNEKPALEGVDLSIRKGQVVGVIGPTGSGKSTFADLLMGLIIPSAGTITIDEIHLTEHNMSSWKSRIAHVPQKIFLADVSVSDNIRFGLAMNETSVTNIVKAARQADAHEFIAKLPAGYDTRIGESGKLISGGQQQRLGLARALYRTADVLVLDEATSALDKSTEDAVMDSVARLMPRPTVVVIAHRMNALKHCDKIVRLDKGQIVEVGTYDEVVQAQAHYLVE